MDKSKGPEISSNWEKIYQLHRARIAQEENLIHYRNLWMIASQAILFTLFGGLYDKVENPLPNIKPVYSLSLKILEVLLCFLGAIAAFGSGYWLNAAVDEIEDTQKSYNNIREKFKTLSLPTEKIFQSVVGKPYNHLMGRIGALFLPGFFILIWIAIISVFVLIPWLWPSPVQGIGGDP